MTTPPESSGAKGPLAAAQKIVSELDGLPKDDQALALKFAMEALKLQLPTAHAQVPHSPSNSPHALPAAPVFGKDIKSFTAAKAPKSDQQFAAVVAYYYQFEAPAEQIKESIDAATMKEAARMAGRKQVNDWNVTLNNAMRTGYLDKGERGAFKLNAVGENLVAITLPDNAAGGNGGGLTKKRVKKKATKAKKA